MLEEFLLNLALLPLCRRGLSLNVELGPASLGSLFQLHEMLIVLLKEGHFLLLHLLVQHDIELLLLLIRDRVQVVCPLPVRIAQLVSS
jgi:hypothetical protein